MSFPPSLPPEPQETRLTRTREEEAQQALTTTRVTPGVAVALLLAFALTLVSIAFVQKVKTGSLTDTAPPRSLTAPALKDYAQMLQSQSVVAQTLLPPTQAFLAGRGGVGNEQAYIGRNGWLFYRPDVEYITGPGFLDAAVLQRRRRAADTATPVQPDPLPALLALNRDLAARDIHLVVVPVPVKPLLEPEQLNSHFAGQHADLQNPSYAAFRDALAAQGVPVCDVSDALRAAQSRTGQPQFLRADTHWTPDAMECAAQKLADFVQEQAWLPSTQTAGYTRSTSQVVGEGDIAAMLRLPPGQVLQPPQSVTVHPVWTARHARWHPEDTADVLLLGDSFSNVYSRPDLGWGAAAGLAEQLSFRWQRPVDRIALNAGGSFAARQELASELARGQDRLRGKRLVIYEFAMRDLSAGDWKALPLAGSSVRRVSVLAQLAAGRGGVDVSGTVQAIAETPRPGSTPYPDCIIALRLTQMHTLVGQQPVGGALIYLWGMRKNHLTTAASYTVGQKISLDLKPWEAVEEQLGGFQRQGLESEKAGEPVYWSDSMSQMRIARPRSLLAAKARIRPPALFQMPPGTGPEVKEYLHAMASQAGQAMQQQKSVLVGQDNWLFLMQDVRSQCAGQFWGPQAYRASQALAPEYADPLPAILDFKRQLDGAGIELLMVPVPAKVSIYPDMLSAGLPLDAEGVPPRVDVFDEAFLSVLRAHNVPVLDLAPLFLAQRRQGGPLLFDKQDTHWSTAGCALAAQAIAERIGQPAWRQDIPRRHYRVQGGAHLVQGDLWTMQGNASFPCEMVERPSLEEQSVTGFWPFQRSVWKSLEPWQQSPVVLLGDSYCIGLQSSLTQQLGFATDMVMTPGSGGENARIQLARRGDLRTGKKIVIWCFSVREFSEELGWQKSAIVYY